MIRQARWLFGFSDKIIVKLPISPAGLQALRDLKQERPDRQVAVTVVASVAQAYLAGKVGPTSWRCSTGRWNWRSSRMWIW